MTQVYFLLQFLEIRHKNCRDLHQHSESGTDSLLGQKTVYWCFISDSTIYMYCCWEDDKPKNQINQIHSFK